MFRQLVIVGGRRYQLEEIYGLEIAVGSGGSVILNMCSFLCLVVAWGAHYFTPPIFV